MSPRRAICASILLSLSLIAADAGAGEVIPIVVTVTGTGAVRIRVAEGPAQPCDSRENRLLLQGKFEPGTVLRSATVDSCVCVQHTRDPFTDVDWTTPVLACRPMVCVRKGRALVCKPAPDPTIRIEARSG